MINFTFELEGRWFYFSEYLREARVFLLANDGEPTAEDAGAMMGGMDNPDEVAHRLARMIISRITKHIYPSN